MPTDRELMQQALDALEKNKRTHYYCEDTWYSCPKHEDGCANDAEGDDCNCGADRINTVLDKTIKALRARLEQPEQAPTNNGRYLTGYKAQPEQEPPCKTGSQCVGKKCERCAEPEPVAKMREMLEVQGQDGTWNYDPYFHGMYNGMEFMLAMVEDREPVFRSSPGKWLGYTAPPQREWQGLTDEDLSVCDEDGVLLARYWEAKLREKNA